MSLPRKSIPLSEEINFQNFCKNISKSFLRDLTPEIIASNIQEICELTKKGDKNTLHHLVSVIIDSRLLEYCAVKWLAKNGDEKSVNFLIDNFHASKSEAAIGYVWGGHSAIYNKISISKRDKLEGFALGRHIEEINKLLGDEKHDCNSEAIAYNYYVEGGHVENFEDSLELITLTTSKRLQSYLVHALKKKIPTVEAEALLKKSEHLSQLMHEQKINYSEALSILTNIENKESKAIPSGNHSSKLFDKSIKIELSYFQKKAVKEFSQHGMTIYAISNWEAPKPYHISLCNQFSLAHFEALRYLLNEENLSAELAVKEIHQLNIPQVSAVRELYAHGLRGQHFRDWRTKNPTTQFTDTKLEKLIKRILKDKIEPIKALDEFSSSVQQAIPVRSA